MNLTSFPAHSTVWLLDQFVIWRVWGQDQQLSVPYPLGPVHGRLCCTGPAFTFFIDLFACILWIEPDKQAFDRCCLVVVALGLIAVKYSKI